MLEDSEEADLVCVYVCVWGGRLGGRWEKVGGGNKEFLFEHVVLYTSKLLLLLLTAQLGMNLCSERSAIQIGHCQHVNAIRGYCVGRSLMEREQD